MPTQLTQITGFTELIQKIRQLASDKDKKAEMVRLLRNVAIGTSRVAKRNTPISKRPHLISGSRTRRIVQPGNLKKSIGVITGRKGKAKTNPTVYVGPRAKGNNDGFYGNFVEYGHNIYRTGFSRKRSSSESARRHNTSGAISRTSENRFMERTYDQTKGQVTAETEAKVVKFIQKRIDKLSTR